MLFLEIADDLMMGSDTEHVGAININTAGSEVLVCLPGITQELADAIVAYRKSAGFFPNVGGLLKVDGMNAQLLKQVVKSITARSETFRILCEGKVNSTGARQRLQVVVRLGPSFMRTLSYREDL